MLLPSMRTARPEDESSILGLITLAFSADPILRWSFPDPSTYLYVMPDIIRYFGGQSLAQGSAFCLADKTGAALWLPPDVQPDFEQLFDLNQKYVSADVLPDLIGVYEEMENYHPADPHWHLTFVGVDPALRLKGLGTKLMHHCLDRLDSGKQLAYLESTAERSLPFYERLGFELLGTIQVGSSPPMFPMLRKPAK